MYSGILVKLKASGAKERVHLDDLKVFVPRGPGTAGSNTVTSDQVSLIEWTAGETLSYDLLKWGTT
jgi:hypothetical protein